MLDCPDNDVFFFANTVKYSCPSFLKFSLHCAAVAGQTGRWAGRSNKSSARAEVARVLSLYYRVSGAGSASSAIFGGIIRQLHRHAAPRGVPVPVKIPVCHPLSPPKLFPEFYADSALDSLICIPAMLVRPEKNGFSRTWSINLRKTSV